MPPAAAHLPRLLRTCAAAWLLTLAGCAAPDMPSLAPPASPVAFAGAAAGGAAGAAAPATAAWWAVFDDPQLDALIQQAGSANTSLQQAGARLAQARAAAQAAGAAHSPQLGLGASVSRQGGPLVNAAGSNGLLIDLSAHASYEADLFGQRSQAAQAARLDQGARTALLQAAHLAMQADIAQACLAWRALGHEQALLRDEARGLAEALALVQRRRRAGLAAAQDAALARAELAGLDAQAQVLARRRAGLAQALAFLLGRHLADAGPLLQDDARPIRVPTIPPGIPAQVLARRPDVAAAVLALQAAGLRRDASQADGLPTLGLTASGGWASADLGDLLRQSARGFGLGALLSLPLFDGGRQAARSAAAQADLDLASAQWREQLLVALREVEDQLGLLQGLAAEAQALGQVLDEARRSAALAASRQASGLASQLEALAAQRQQLQAQRALLQVQAARQQASVGLVRALGGGWGDALPTPPLAALAAAGSEVAR